jgi:hypothetical protein
VTRAHRSARSLASSIAALSIAAVSIATALALAVTTPAANANMSTLGGPVMHSERTHVIFWQPAGTALSFDPAYEQQIETFLRHVGNASRSSNNVFGLMGQYRGPGGPAVYASTFAGAVVDTDPLPAGSGSGCHEPLPPPLGEGPGWTVCVNDAGLQSELAAVVHGRGLPVGLQDVYFLVLPDGFASCLESGPSDCAVGGDANNGYCGYHQDIGSSRILYAVIPYNALAGHCRSENPRPNASPADPTIATIAHELAESATDPLGDGWTDNAGNEIADICLRKYGPNLGGSSGSTAYNQVIDGGHYYLQELWSNADRLCEPAAAPDRASIRAPARAGRGVAVTLSARASAPGRRIVSYAWSFVDGASARGRQVQHTFGRGGRSKVALTVRDSWGNEVSASRRITVGR